MCDVVWIQAKDIFRIGISSGWSTSIGSSLSANSCRKFTALFPRFIELAFCIFLIGFRQREFYHIIVATELLFYLVLVMQEITFSSSGPCFVDLNFFTRAKAVCDGKWSSNLLIASWNLSCWMRFKFLLTIFTLFGIYSPSLTDWTWNNLIISNVCRNTSQN